MANQKGLLHHLPCICQIKYNPGISREISRYVDSSTAPLLISESETQFQFNNYFLWQDLNKILSKEWKELSDDKKSPYVKKFKEAWKEYQTKMSSWEEEMVRQGKESLIRAGSRPVKMRSAGRPKSAIKEIKKSSNLHRG